MHQQGEHGCGQRTRQHQRSVVQREPCDDTLAIAACTDERRDGGRADIDHRRSLDASEDRTQRQRQFDAQQACPARQPEGLRRIAQ